jgi:hypothetical protein
MKKLFFLLSVSFIYISCEKVIPFEGDVNIPKLVINSIFQSDSTFKVHVSSSRSVIDTASFQNIEDAIVTIKDDNGSTIEILNYVENGFYIGQNFPQENQTYNLEVTHPNYPNVTSSDSLPSPIIINSIDSTTIVDPINGDRLQITLDFEDPKSAQNYYLIETYSVNEYLVIKNSDTTDYELDTIKQLMILTDEVFQNGSSPFREQGLFNDLLFNGQNKKLELEIPYDNFSEIEVGYEWSYKTLSVRVYLHNISKSYYYYRTSLELYQSASGNPFAQPVQVYSNIENGFGVFAGSQISYFDL